MQMSQNFVIDIERPKWDKARCNHENSTPKKFPVVLDTDQQSLHDEQDKQTTVDGTQVLHPTMVIKIIFERDGDKDQNQQRQSFQKRVQP